MKKYLKILTLFLSLFSLCIQTFAANSIYQQSYLDGPAKDTIDSILNNSWLYDGENPTSGSSTFSPGAVYKSVSCSGNDSKTEYISIESLTPGWYGAYNSVSVSTDVDHANYSASANAEISVGIIYCDEDEVVNGYYTTYYKKYDGTNVSTYMKQVRVFKGKYDGKIVYVPVDANGRYVTGGFANVSTSNWYDIDEAGFSQNNLYSYSAHASASFCGISISSVANAGSNGGSDSRHYTSDIVPLQIDTLISTEPYSYENPYNYYKSLIYEYYQDDYAMLINSLTFKLVANMYKKGITANLNASQLDNIVSLINSNTDQRVGTVLGSVNTINSNLTQGFNIASSNLTTKTNDILNRINSVSTTLNDTINSLSSKLINDTYSLQKGTALPFSGTLVNSSYMNNPNAYLYQTANGYALVKWYTSPTTVGDLIIR